MRHKLSWLIAILIISGVAAWLVREATSPPMFRGTKLETLGWTSWTSQAKGRDLNFYSTGIMSQTHELGARWDGAAGELTWGEPQHRRMLEGLAKFDSLFVEMPTNHDKPEHPFQWVQLHCSDREYVWEVEKRRALSETEEQLVEYLQGQLEISSKLPRRGPG